MNKGIVRIAVVAIIIVGFAGCSDLKKKLFPVFNVNIPAINLTIPAIPLVANSEVPVGALKTHINMDSTIRANTKGAFGASSVTAVTVKKVVIEVLNADKRNNLSNFESGRMRIYSNTNTAAIDIADISFPTTYTERISVENKNSPDISEYLRGSELAYNLYWKNRRTTTKRLKLSVKVTLGVQ